LRDGIRKLPLERRDNGILLINRESYQMHEILTLGDFLSAFGVIQGMAKEIRHGIECSASRRL
jgi:hypothetical protein